MELKNNCETNSKEEKNIINELKPKKDKSSNIIKMKRSTFIFYIVLFSAIIIILCVVLVLILIKKNKNKNDSKQEEKIENENIEENENTESNDETKLSEIFDNYENIIDAVYKVKNGEKMSFFNNEKMNLKDEGYIIKEKSFTNNDLRNLKNIEIINGFHTPAETGYLTVEIIFKKSFNNLDNLFLNNKELIKVDMTNFEMKEISSMKSTFSGCSNLEEVNFEGSNSENLKNMDNTFENCINLKNINLSLKNTSKLEETRNTFIGCYNLETINLTTFQNIKEDMFNGIKSTPTIIANEYISNSISNIFFNIFNIKINIIIEIIIPIRECDIGDGEKCKICSNINKKNCLTCNDGYYLPFDANNREKCFSCNIIAHCSSCFGIINNIICSSCLSGYYLENNECKNEKEIIQICTIGENQLCKKCNSNENLKNECEDCNEGYYLPSDAQNRSFCENCNKIKGCIECSGTKINPICSKCLNGYNLANNNCIEELCVIGEKEKCKSCRKEIERKKECETCNDGYYIWGNENYECLKCSIKNCKKCSRQLNSETCEECSDNFILSNENICVCPSDYKLTNDTICQQYENWIEAEYDISNNRSVSDFVLLDQGSIIPREIDLNNVDMYINDTKIPISIYNNGFYYNFTKLGKYIIKINFKRTLNHMNSFFMNIHTLKKIRFLETFDATKIYGMSNMFNGCYVEIIDMKYLKTDNLENLKSFLWGASYLNNLQLSNSFDTSKVTNMENMFYNNIALKEIDLSYFDTSNVENCIYMFEEFPIDNIVKISNKFTKCREFIPLENKIINIDEIACQNFEHCKECIGSKETLSCSVCEIGYELKDNICVQSKCNVGLENKCKKCQIFPNNENECLSCNEGYYLPLNSSIKTECKKCNIEGCKICDVNTGNCLECKRFYNPILDPNSKLILSCEIICELGEQNKCATCNEEKGKEYQCSSCNKGYRLMKNGTCKKIENSFIAIYNITTLNSPTPLMKQMLGHINSYKLDLTDIDAYINGKKIDIIICDDYYFCYKFPHLGLIEVKIIINKTLQTMQELFYYIRNLIEIKFSDTFDTSHVLSTDSMFDECHSLRSANLSSFNTTIDCTLIFMFNFCYELTSIDLSNFDTRNVRTFQQLFYQNKKLNYIDISSFNTLNAYTYNIFTGVAPNGTLIINKNTYNGDIPNGWNIIYKE